MTVLERLRLPPEASSARAARRFVADVLGAVDEVAELAVLLVSELASNAIQHARTEFEVCVAADATCIRIDVEDGNPRLPSLRNYVPRSTSGRGLHMVAASARHWGFEATPAGKVVWFELDRKPS
jgi:anti-sigma regulatory factor (Ser/Thr protein kinase)